ncbi:hypothetical protein [Brumimicrobium mesophilum]|nr:hypothetical protein [Brumimicrobium mesophilum]
MQVRNRSVGDYSWIYQESLRRTGIRFGIAIAFFGILYIIGYYYGGYS